MSHKSYCFTLNNPVSDPVYDDTVMNYLCFGREVAPITGTPHLQGYVTFKKPQRISKKWQSILGHMIPAIGTKQQNIDYCKKDSDFVEFGESSTGGETNKRRYEDAWENAKKGNFEDIPKDILIRQYHTLKEIRKDYMQKPDDLTVLDNYWFWGDSGTGKSVYARKTYPGSYYKLCNKWWDGYQGEKTVIIEDFDSKHEVLGHHLKIWGDYGFFIAEIKGGAIAIRPKQIIITSNYHPRCIWSDKETLEPISRRFQILHFNKDI